MEDDDHTPGSGYTLYILIELHKEHTSIYITVSINNAIY